MYEYKEEDLWNIKALRTIIEFMLREHYLRLNADSTMNYYYSINVALLFSNGIPMWAQWISNRVTFAFNNWGHRWYLNVKEEVTTAHFWWRLRDNNYLFDNSKYISWDFTSLRDKDIWYISKYIRQNVLVRNVKLFQ